jgi:hypothetical protein
VRHARQLNREVLGQRRKRPTRFGKHNTCGNYDCTDGRQLGCTECGCTHQYRHNNNDYYDYDNHHHDYNDDNSRTNHYNDFYNVNYDNDDGCTDYYDYVNNINDSCSDNYDYVIDDNNRCAACVHRPLDDNDVNISCTNHDDNSARSCATAHGQRIRQQFIRVKQRAKTATQQTRISVTRRRCGDMRGVSRVQCPPSPQPAHGETFAIGMHLSINPSSRAGSHPKRAVHPVGHGSDHGL